MQNSKTPIIRFKGFNDAWVQRRINDSCVLSKGKGYSKSDLLNNGYEIILYGRLYTNYETVISSVNTFVARSDSAVLSECGDVIVPASGESPEDIARASVVDKNGIILGGDLNIIKIKNKGLLPVFLALGISNGNPKRNLIKRAQGKSIVHLRNSDIENIDLFIPKVDEQEKISIFFNTLDKLIALYQRKTELLELMKKEYLNCMFPQKGSNIPRFRFNRFSDFWKQYNLSDILIERNVLQQQNNEYPLVSFTVEKGVTPKTDRYEREQLVRGDKLAKKYKTTELDDIVYNPANLKFGAIARNKYGKAVFSPIYVTFEVNANLTLPKYVERIVTRRDFIQYSLRYQQGTVYERQSVSPEDLLSLSILLSSIEEQEVIANIFDSFDKLINLSQRKVDVLSNIKLVYLNNMFI